MDTALIGSNIKYDKSGFDDETLRSLYLEMLRPRLIEEKMLKLLRQGRISKWFSGIGQEAISIGVTKVLKSDEVVFPMHRNLGVFTTRGVPMWRLFAQWEGKTDGFTKGRDRSFHFGAMDYGIVGMISHLGAQLSVADGVALAHRLSNEGRLSIAFTGEGGTSEGEFHEALNVASVWNLPVIFIIENNGYGLSTPTSEQYNANDLADRALGYGMEGVVIDGNNVLEVHKVVRELAVDIRNNPRPVLVECKTFRMRGHEEASGVKYVPKELLEAWSKRDPLTNYEAYLLKVGVISENEIKNWHKEIQGEIEAELVKAGKSPEVTVSEVGELDDVFFPYEADIIAPNNKRIKMRFVDAIKDGLHESMLRYENLVLMGQDIAEYGGVFKITDGFVNEFGHGRVRNTPICESAIVGVCMGLSLKGYKSMVEMQFSDFVTCGFNQIVNYLAKVNYRWGQNADVVIRMPTGAGVAAGPFHSQSTEAWFTHVPGLKVVYPSNPEDAKGLLIAALEDPNPVLFFEHKALYRSVETEVSEGYFTTPIGKAAIVQSGSRATIITYGAAVHWCLEMTKEQDIEIVDLRTLNPLDYETMKRSIIKTNRVMLVHEDTQFGGIGGEISAWIGESLFEHLDAPILRVCSLDTPVPFNVKLENQFLAKSRIRENIEKLLSY